MTRLTKILKVVTFTFVYSLLCCKSAIADDIEVFFASPSTAANTNPNILFIFDTSGSMSRNQSFEEDGVTVSQSRIGILQDVMSEVVSSLSGVNLGLSRFSVPGGPILFPVTNPDDPADPIVLRSLASADDDAVQSGVNVTLDSAYLDPIITGSNGIIAVRFENVGIPQGAIINRATVLLSGDQASADLGADYEIYAEVSPSAAPFTIVNKNLSDRISGTPILWSADTWGAEVATADYEVQAPTVIETPDLASVLQPVVNQGDGTLTDPLGWCGGNDLVILFKKVGTSGRPFISHDQSTDFSPSLRVDFDATIPTGRSGCYANKITKQVQERGYDSESGRGGSGSTDLDFYRDTYYRENNASIAMSFEDIGIPQGAEISSATLSFVSRSRSNGAANTTIYAVNSEAPPLDSSVHSLPALAFTTGIPWSIESWDYGVPYQSVDISSIVGSVVALPGWDETGDLTFKLVSTSGTRTAYSYDGSRSRSPKLEITFVGKYSVSAATKRQAIIASVEDFKATGNTPISDTYAEAVSYFKGEAVKYGLVRGSPSKRDNRISHIDSVVTGSIITPPGCSESNPSATACKDERYSGAPVYKSPITDSCQVNHIILLTDGAPTSHDRDTNALFEDWTTELTGTTGTCRTNDSGADCTVKMAGLVQNNDVIPGGDTEQITTHTIGFYSDQTFLQNVADAGGGSYVTAFSKDELFGAINTIVDSILDVNTTFVSAGVTVNQYNRVTHSDELYFSLFSPSSETVWPGNLKRYRLSEGQIVDFNSSTAVTLTGEFDEAALSYWSSEVDGNEVEIGGAASRLTNARRVYSNLGGGNDLNAAANRVIDSNAAVTSAMVGAVDAADRTKVLDWTTGEDVNDLTDPTLARQKMGDPLHSQPNLLIYETSPGVFRTSVYVGTNDGFLHSFDTETGDENWSFIPKQLLPRLSELQKNTIGAHTYGLDGNITLHIANDEGVLGVVDGVDEKAVLYVGMRRGGSSYFAIDITDPDDPQLLFTIDPAQTEFAGMGQSWSKPVVKKMDITNHETVMIFGGGYSAEQDTAGTASVVDSQGKNIYIVDAFTGELLWDISSAVDISGGTSAGSLITMNAIPNEVTAFDITGDQYIDHIYATDTKAQVFRFDIDYDNDEIRGGRIAHLQTTPNAANNRRFYNKPDVSLVRTTDENFIAIAIGSGYRAHPLDETVTDHFYMIKDEGVLTGTFDMDAGMADLVNVTNLIGDTDANGTSDAAEIINDETSPKDGWYIDFANSGEKVISNSVTFNNAVIFTTYTPPGASGNSCDAQTGTSRIYGMKVTDGNPYIDSNYDGQLTELDRSAALTTAGIAPEPQVLLEGSNDGVTPRLCVGNQCGLEAFLPPIPEGVMGIRWHRKEN